MADANEWPIPWQEVAGDRGGALAWVQYGALRASLGVAARLPRLARRALSAALAVAAMRLDRRHTRSAREFVAQALGSSAGEAERERLVRSAWRHLIELALEDARYNARVLGPRVLEHYQVELGDDARRALAGGRGGLLIVPHAGHWEALAAAAVALGFRPLYAVSRPPRNRPLSRFLQATREQRGFRLIHRRGAGDLIRAIVGAGGWAALMIDQRARGKKAIVAPFFGRPAHCERSVPLLARRLRAPLVFAACYREAQPWRYRIVFSSVLWPEQLDRLDPLAAATAINRELERLILARPEQYFWLHDRYYKAPPAQ